MSSVEQHSSRRVCVYSQRAIRQDVSRCSGYEFEDVVGDLETSVLAVPELANKNGLKFRSRRWMSQRSGMFEYLPSGARYAHGGEDFDLFCCFVQKPVELLMLDAFPDWKRRSKLSVCILEEVWGTNISSFKPLIRSLSKFDLITSAFASSCEELRELTGRPVLHLPGAADMKRFAPVPGADRPIDFYSIGRRRNDLHAVLKQELEARQGFYLYDSATRPPIAADHRVHRDLFASLVQRSKLFFVDLAKIGHVDQSKGQASWGPRHVEGMAGGAVQVGYAPDSDDYNAYFDWPEAVLRLPEDPGKAADVILDLLNNEAEMERRRGICLQHALRKHDWVHRWATILDHFELPKTARMLAREKELEIDAATFRERSNQRRAG